MRPVLSRTMLMLSMILTGAISETPVAIAASSAEKGSEAPRHVISPILSADEQSIVLVWEKPISTERRIVDYIVYRDGEKLGSVRQNLDVYSPAKAYIDNFYQNLSSDGWAQPVDLRSYTVTGLQPDKEYAFTIRALYENGQESAASDVLKVRTTKQPHIIDVRSLGAKGDGNTLNTQVLQQAIDQCTIALFPEGCRVVIKGGVFKSGALFLHSDMTLEIDKGATLLGSDDPEQYPFEKGYLLYPYQDHPQPLRPPSLINAFTLPDKGEAPAGTFKNIRITGLGIIDGNGWQRGVKVGGVSEITDEVGTVLPQYRASNPQNISHDGVLAKNQTERAIAAGVDRHTAYKNSRSSLMTLRGVENLYLSGLTIRNPAFHGIMALESKNITLNGLIHQTFDGNNADGIEFGNSQNSLVFNNFFDTGDDSVNFAAGFGKDAKIHHQHAQSGAWIFNNYFRKGHGAVVTGSHTGAWIEKIRAEDNVMYQTDIGLRMKSRPYYGGGVRDIIFRNNAMKDLAKQPFIFTIKYSADVNDTIPADEPAQFRDIRVEHVSVDGTRAKASILVDGMTVSEMTSAYGMTFPRDAFHRNLNFSDVRFRKSPPVQISFLRDSEFRGVTFVEPAAIWHFSDVDNVTVADNPLSGKITHQEK